MTSCFHPLVKDDVGRPGLILIADNTNILWGKLTPLKIYCRGNRVALTGVGGRGRGHLHCCIVGRPVPLLSLNTTMLQLGLFCSNCLCVRGIYPKHLSVYNCSSYLNCECTDVLNCWSYLAFRSTTIMLTTELIVLKQLTE